MLTPKGAILLGGSLALIAAGLVRIDGVLITLGVAPDRVETVTFGKERPVVPGSDDQSYLLNRRAVTRVRGMTGS